ncbi:MAG: radical SAM protein [Desulfobacteraceae bacterium]|nr:radical SAM protein [Desulfobacteraceae bacterium]
MKILLVQLPTSHLGAGEKVYPLGLSRLSSTLPPLHDKQVLDMNIAMDPWPDLKEKIEGFRPDAIVLSFRNLDPLAGHQASYLSSLKTGAALARNLAPEARIMAGGPAFSLFARRLMEEAPEIDMGLKGEGELIFPRLFEPDLDPGGIPGILWRNNGMIVENPLGPKLSMDELPPMDVEAFPPLSYTKGNAYIAAVGIEGKRGCDLWCGYCLYPFLGGCGMRLRSPSKIADEMTSLNHRFGIKLFHFTDSVVNRPREHFEALCRELVNRNLGLSWTGFFREDSLTRDNLALARKAGCVAIYFSGDSLTDHGLKLLNKRMTKQDLFNAAKITADNGILTMCHFLLNLPGEEDKERMETRETLDRLLSIHANAGNLGAVIFNHVRLYPGAPMTKRLIKSGALSPDTDLLYPVYHNPEPHARLLHELEARCHMAGVFSRLKLPMEAQ